MLELLILVGSSSLSLYLLHLHIALKFLAREHEVIWLLAVVTNPLSTLSTLSTVALPSANAIALLHGT